MSSHRRRLSVLFASMFLVLTIVIGSSVGLAASKTKIRLATWAGVDEANELQEILDRLNAKSTTYEIIQESSPAEYDTKLITTLAAEAGADLYWIGQEKVPSFASRGVMMDLTDRMKASKHPAGNLDDYFGPTMERMMYQGKVYALPWINQPVMVYVNLDLFDKEGIAYPDETWDWDKFLAVAKALTVDKNGRHPGDDGFDSENVERWGFTLNGWPPIQMFIWQAGGDVISEDFKSCPVDSKEAIQGAEFYVDLIHKHHVAPPLSIIRDRGFDTMYTNGQVAMFMGGAADDLDYKPDFRSQAFMIPKGPSGRRYSFLWVGGMAINAKTKNPDVAFEAFLDLSDAIHHWKVVPPRKSLATAEALADLKPEKKHSLPAIVEAMNDSRSFRIFPNYAEWDSIFWDQYADPLINGRGTAEELAKRVKPLLEKTLTSK
ncbi:MAG: sugar ABC transporter substrate-binding protein [Firmicutes bacterium]|nr:sugar ABC transporter substrate-binding protein [Bacillota bacterium]